jgi:hypothetical protein
MTSVNHDTDPWVEKSIELFGRQLLVFYVGRNICQAKLAVWPLLRGDHARGDLPSFSWFVFFSRLTAFGFTRTSCSGRTLRILRAATSRCGEAPLANLLLDLFLQLGLLSEIGDGQSFLRIRVRCSLSFFVKVAFCRRKLWRPCRSETTSSS